MKLIKYFFAFLVIMGIGILTWLYYPQYEIYKLKKHEVEASRNTSSISYLNYFRNIKTTSIDHLAIGDSVIRGMGAGQHQDLVFQFSNQLAKQTHKKIQFKNEGINGITSGELNDLVQAGRFDNEIKKADIITINVGGNDILRKVKDKNLRNVFQTFDQLQTTFSTNLTDITTRIKKLNPKATIVYLELYNPLTPTNEFYPLADKLLPNWNLNIYEVANQYPTSVVVETTKVINGKNLNNLSADGVHPNSAGYSAISDQMIYQLRHQYRKNSI